MKSESFATKRSGLTIFWAFVLALVLSSIVLSAEGRELNESFWGPYLTLKDGSTVVVNWKSDQGYIGGLNYERADFYLENEELRKSAREQEGGGLFHHVELDGLTPGMEYVYSIGKDSGDRGVNYFGNPRDDPSNFTFFVYGDTRTCPGRHRLVASEMALDPFDPSFIIHTGDLVESPVSNNWSDFFWAIKPFSKSTPILPVLGNHERNHESYYDAFGLPQGGGDYGEQWYSFSHGGAKFIVLDSNADQMGLSNFLEEREWLVEELENNTKPVTVVIFHHPIYSSVYSEGVDAGLADSWGSLFEKHGVDLVFNGHVHSYERAVKNGVTYVVTGGGGAPTGNLSSRFDFSRKAKGDSLHYVRVSMDKSEIKLQTIEVARINRDADAGRVDCNVDMTADRVVIDEAVIDVS
ncbi:MAG: metallophosphoesterase family protein [Candidatus Bipolaricaulota bacterium]|nr:metallophosphoesterase family protein [Candidatus Bipolaricaulota bacterium]MBS3791892.1 metallophosphoesterase family protein [Candidatus Bipolaricaulota bacterium]